jgi:hypothetical protein
VKLPISELTIRIKAYTLAEEKNFILLAEAAGDKADIIFTVVELVRGCVVKPNDFDPEDLCMTDVCVAFLKICEISKGNMLDLNYRCLKTVNGEKCNGKIPVQINITDYKIEYPNDMSPKDIKKPVKLWNDISVTINYPSMKDLRAIDAVNGKKEKIEANFRAVCNSIDTVYQNKEAFTDFTKEELYEWFLQLPFSVFDEIKDRFETIPLITKTIDLECPDCGNKSQVKLRSLEDFFDSSIRGLDM